LSIQSWFYLVGIFVALSILVVRTSAIWINSRKIAWSLRLLLVGMFAGSAYFLSRFVRSVILGASPSPKALPGCFIIYANTTLWIPYLFILIFETCIFAMTLYKLIKDSGHRSSTLARTIYRDGIVFYAYLLSISIVNIAVLNAVPPEMKTTLTGLHRTLHVLFSERIILNIRGTVGTRQPVSGHELASLGNFQFPTLDGPHFAEPESSFAARGGDVFASDH